MHASADEIKNPKKNYKVRRRRPTSDPKIFLLVDKLDGKYDETSCVTLTNETNKLHDDDKTS